MKTYTDLDQYNPDYGDLKVLQNLDLDLPMKNKKNTVIVQNITIEDPLRRGETLYESILDEIIRSGGMKEFIAKVYTYAIEKHGTRARAATRLGIKRRTLDYFMQKQLTE